MIDADMYLRAVHQAEVAELDLRHLLEVITLECKGLMVAERPTPRDTVRHLAELLHAERKKAAQLDVVLARYGQHDEGCSTQHPQHSARCDCGWAEARAILGD